ncbi:SRPBCC domain-containing protein [Oceaniglobus roseus]|uniref:SRPBCC domain-containing protein n=1 Tax=Oceaniglobus roseus TaxID=1737570 RepID=UPI000C7EA520|nr:SRPBCC domain-containing protein [Kandeliimicrobium roseum]
MSAKPGFVMQTFIRCTQDALWDALTDPDRMGAWHFMARRAELEGDTYALYLEGGAPLFRMRKIADTPKTRIEATFEPQWEGGGAPSRTVFLIRPEGPYCALTVEHYDLTFPVVPTEGVADGWSRWAASLKTWLETGSALRMAMPASAEAGA